LEQWATPRGPNKNVPAGPRIVWPPTVIRIRLRRRKTIHLLGNADTEELAAQLEQSRFGKNLKPLALI
jgi:hypothetical protein